MLETALLMLTAHLLGDFVFQPDALIARKTSAAGMLGHVAIIGVLTALCLTPTHGLGWCAVLIVTLTHLIMDMVKVHLLGDRLWAFLADQAVHLAVIAAVAVLWPGLAQQSLLESLPGNVQANVYAGLALVCGLTVGIPVGGVVIRKLVEPLMPASPIAGMKNAGRYIGWLERALSITFFLINQPEAIGFLLAAKSILRFRDIQDQTDRHQAEYIIIGTFLSFGWALLTALAARAAINHWLG